MKARRARGHRRRALPAPSRAARAVPARSGSAPPTGRRPRRGCRSRGASRPWRYGCRRSTPVSSSATVTPEPSKPGDLRDRPAGRSPGRTPRCRATCGAARPDTRRARGRRPRPRGRARASARNVGSIEPAKPLSTRTKDCSGSTGAPRDQRPAMACRCAARAAAVQARICRSVAVTSGAARRDRRATARAGRRSTGRRAAGSGRLPSSPCHPAAPTEGLVRAAGRTAERRGAQSTASDAERVSYTDAYASSPR